MLQTLDAKAFGRVGELFSMLGIDEANCCSSCPLPASYVILAILSIGPHANCYLRASGRVVGLRAVLKSGTAGDVRHDDVTAGAWKSNDVSEHGVATAVLQML